MKPQKTFAMLLLSGLLVQGCCSANRAPSPTQAQDNTALLLNHPQFHRAASVAPDFVNDAFKVITRLEKELADAGR